MWKVVLSAVVFGGGLNAYAQDLCQVVAAVGKEAITEKDVLERIALDAKLEGQSPRYDQKTREETLRLLVREAAQRHSNAFWHTSFGTKVSSEESRKILDEWESDIRKTYPQFQLSDVERKHLIRKFMADVGWKRYVEGRYGHTIQVTPAEIEAFKYQWKKQLNEPRYRYKFLKLYYTGDPRELRGVTRSISDALEQNAGFLTDEIVAEYSKDPAKGSGGIVEESIRTKGVFKESMEKAQARLKQGQALITYGPFQRDNKKELIFFMLLSCNTPREMQVRMPSEAEIQTLLRQRKMEICQKNALQDLTQSGACMWQGKKKTTLEQRLRQN